MRVLQRALAFDGQCFHHRLLKRQGDIATNLLVSLATRALLLPGIQGKSLQAAETEVQPRSIGHRPREDKPPRHATFSQARNLRPARIDQPEHLGGLVEGLASGIVQRLAEQRITADAIHAYQLGMATRHQQSDERKLRRLLFQHWRQQMTFHVVHAQRRNLPGKR